MFRTLCTPRFILVLMTIALQGATIARADTITGIVTGAGGVPLAGATIEVQGSAVTATSNLSGAFSLTLPRGTYDLQVFPPAGLSLAPSIVEGVILNGVANVGTVGLSAGVLISGNVTANSVAVVGGDLDVFDVATGIKLEVENDTTGVGGAFTIRLPARNLRLRAEPLAGQLFVATELIGNFVTSQNVGAINLPTGFALTGTVRNSATGLPLAGVDIDVDDVFTGQRIPTPGDSTNALGIFNVVVPAGTFHVTIEPTTAQAFVARQERFLAVSGSTNLGNIDLDPGIFLSGTVLDPSGHPARNVDIDVRNEAGDTNVFIGNDETDSTGQFGVVVLPGSHRVVAEPDRSTQWVAQSNAFAPHSTSQSVGTFSLVQGALLSGHVASFFGGLELGCRVVLRDNATGAVIETTGNITDSASNYLVVAPLGSTVDVDFLPRNSSPSKNQTITGISVNGSTTLNANLTLVETLTYLDDPSFPGPQVVQAGDMLFFTIAIFNPNGFSVASELDVEIIDPYGNVSTLVANSPVLLGNMQAIFSPLFGLFLPPHAPANVGLPHKFRIRVKDPVNGAFFDSDEMTYIPLL